MALLQNRDLASMMYDFYAMAEYNDEISDLNRTRQDDDVTHLNSDLNNGLDIEKSAWDTSALEARNGKDIQGIAWERLCHSRDTYREARLNEYRNYENFSISPGQLEKESHHAEKGNSFFDFQFNTRLVKPTISHFQLRNLVWATRKHDVYVKQNYLIKHWSSLTRRSKDVLDVAKPVVGKNKCPRAISHVQVSTMAVKDDIMALGGFNGELICKHMDNNDVAFCAKVSSDDAITNSVDVCCDFSGSLRVMSGNNDAVVRIFDVENFTCISQFSFPWSINNTSLSPEGKLLAVLGDNVECLLADSASGKVLERLKGHYDYSFVSAWHPDGRIMATGNQDKTCRLWDVRNLSKCLSVLRGRMGAVRALRFTLDGRFLAMAEAADFVHVFDVACDYSRVQEIDLFGEISGISFSPDAEALFVGVADRKYGSLMEFRRRRFTHYLDVFC